MMSLGAVLVSLVLVFPGSWPRRMAVLVLLGTKPLSGGFSRAWSEEATKSFSRTGKG